MAVLGPQGLALNALMNAINVKGNAGLRAALWKVLSNPVTMQQLGMTRGAAKKQNPVKATLGSIKDKVLGGVRNTVGYGLDLGGKLTQAAGVGGGALLGAAGQAPNHFANMFQSEAQRRQYGGNPLTFIGGVSSDVAPAAGITLSALTGAVGSSMSDIGNAFKLAQLDSDLKNRSSKYGDMLKHMNLNEAELDVLARYISAQRRMS